MANTILNFHFDYVTTSLIYISPSTSSSILLCRNMLQFWMNWWKKLPSLLLFVQFSLQVSARQLAHFLEIGLSVFLDMLKQPNRAPVDYYLTCPKHIVMPLWAHFGLVLAIIGPFLALWDKKISPIIRGRTGWMGGRGAVEWYRLNP